MPDKRNDLAAGDLPYRVELQQDEGEEQDDRGQEIEDWLPQCKVWANIEYKAGGEQFRGGQVAASSEWEVTLRKNTSLGPAGWRIVKTGGPYAGTYYPVSVSHTEAKTIAHCRRED